MQSAVFSSFLRLIDERVSGRGPGNTPFPEPEREAAERAYGRRLFMRFAEIYPSAFGGFRHPLDYLEGLTDAGDGESRTSLLSVERPGESVLVLDYRSDRPSPYICCGLIEGCARHFGARVTVTVHPVIGSASPRFKFLVRTA